MARWWAHGLKSTYDYHSGKAAVTTHYLLLAYVVASVLTTAELQSWLSRSGYKLKGFPPSKPNLWIRPSVLHHSLLSLVFLIFFNFLIVCFWTFRNKSITAVFTVIDRFVCTFYLFRAILGLLSRMVAIHTRDQVDGASSWEVCMSKSYCEYVKLSQNITVDSHQKLTMHV